MDSNNCHPDSLEDQADHIGRHPNGVAIKREQCMNRPIRNDKFVEEKVFPDTTIGQLLQGISRSFLIKQEPRIGWARKSACSDSKLLMHPCESVASHQWGVSWLIMTIAATNEFKQELPYFDQLKAIQMAMTHDLAELVTGDITPVDGISPEVKHQRESHAMDSILSAYPEIVALSIGSTYQQYEGRECLESKFVKDCDRLDFMINAFVLERQGFTGFEEFYTNSGRGQFSTRAARDMADLLVATRNDLAKTNSLFRKSNQVR